MVAPTPIRPKPIPPKVPASLATSAAPAAAAAQAAPAVGSGGMGPAASSSVAAVDARARVTDEEMAAINAKLKAVSAGSKGQPRPEGIAGDAPSAPKRQLGSAPEAAGRGASASAAGAAASAPSSSDGAAAASPPSPAKRLLPAGPQPASFLRFVLLTPDGEEATDERASELAACSHDADLAAAALQAAGASGIGRTAAQPYSGIRGQYSWEELASGNLCIELPEGAPRPARLLAQLWEQPNYAEANRALVPKLGLGHGSKDAAGSEGASMLALPDPTAPPATPLASAVVTLDPSCTLATSSDASAAALATLASGSNGWGAAGDDETAGEMEVLLKGRSGLGRDYRVRFAFRIAIW